jgi:hypothetical protein
MRRASAVDVGVADAAVVGALATEACGGGKRRSHGLTTAAPRKIPMTKVRMGTVVRRPRTTGSMSDLVAVFVHGKRSREPRSASPQISPR